MQLFAVFVDELLIASQILIFLFLPYHIYICTLHSIEHVMQKHKLSFLQTEI